MGRGNALDAPSWAAQMSRRHKYRAKRCVCPETGEKFDSQSEYRRWRELQLLQMAGEIRNLQRQVRYPLAMTDGTPILITADRYKNGRQASYTADFVYEEDEIGIVIEEYKNYDTTESRLRRAVFEAQYKQTIRMTGKQLLPKKKRRTNATL